MYMPIQEWETQMKIREKSHCIETIRKSRFHITYTKSLIEFQFIFTSFFLCQIHFLYTLCYLKNINKNAHIERIISIVLILSSSKGPAN